MSNLFLLLGGTPLKCEEQKTRRRGQVEERKLLLSVPMIGQVQRLALPHTTEFNSREKTWRKGTDLTDKGMENRRGR